MTDYLRPPGPRGYNSKKVIFSVASSAAAPKSIYGKRLAFDFDLCFPPFHKRNRIDILHSGYPDDGARDLDCYI